jgi:hypothetical protein
MIRVESRGQTLPLWAVAILSSLVLMFFAINYGNVLRWQIRAQNNADSAASTFVALQAETWNQVTALLYASDVEEFRIRKQMDNLYNIIHNSGGCYPALDGGNPGGDTFDSPGGAGGSCEHAWAVLVPYLRNAVSRYTSDVTVLQSVIQNSSFTELYDYNDTGSDAYKLLQALNSRTHCMSPAAAGSFSPNSGDCSFTYNIVGVKKRGGLLAASHDAWHTQIPNPGYQKLLQAQCGAGFGATGKPPTIPSSCSANAPADDGSADHDYNNASSSNPYFNDEYFAPAQVEVTACAIVKPIIPSLPGFSAPTYYAIGRAAATSVMVAQDWLQPGVYSRQYNPSGTTTKYQDLEPYESFIDGQTYGSMQWYNLSYGALDYWAFPSNNYFSWGSGLSENDFEGAAAWWAPIPIAPFSGSLGSVTTNTVTTQHCGGAGRTGS